MKRCALIWVMLVLLSFLFACVPSTPSPTTTQSVEAIYTAAWQTVSAQLTLEVGGTAVARLTEMAQTAPPTSTPGLTAVPVVGTESVQGPAPEPTAIEPPPTSTPEPTSAPAPCDWASFAGDVSVVEIMSFAPGAAFTKIWRVQNTGACAWTAGYSVVYAGGDPLGAILGQPLPATVFPGETIDLAVNMTAPTAPGNYRGEWLLRNPYGMLFGSGPQGTNPLVVQIEVNPVHQMGNFAYDFTTNYCAATWRSGAGPVYCTGSGGGPGGSILLMENPDLETVLEDELALWARPDNARNGWISGHYPPYRVRNGDRFVAELGCLNHNRGCDVTFAVDYQFSDGRVFNLGEWEESYDGQSTRIEVDISGLAGSAVEFILSVYNNGNPAAANAFWLVPHIDGAVSASELVLTWRQEGGPDDVCDEVYVYLTGLRSGSARIFSCAGRSADRGTVRLTENETRRLTELENRLKTFEADVYSANPGEPFTSWMNFSGRGTAEATNTEILELQAFAEQLLAALP